MRRAIGAILLIGVAVMLPASDVAAGTISLSWDPTSGAAGYRVYYGTSSGQYTGSVTSTSTSAMLTGLQDCTTYFVAVKAYNSAGESPNFSTEMSGWARPTVNSATPNSAMQGDQVVIDINGTNFQPGAVVDFQNPQIVPSSVSVLSCTHLQLLATIEPRAKRVRPAKVGRLDVIVSNPDDVFGQKPQLFEVLMNPARFDVNQSDDVTRNRIDGKDTVYLSRQFGIDETNPNYDPDDDFDGDGWVDGRDLAYIASNLGRCWSSSSKSWSLAACPVALR
ncbi:MAG TPA: fibronectin type III domain-containing protein [Candidatus Polarisedimenticolaceae bacterium]|nr:fibronectin type III domain-containing protein [Candidatus Polarisedimenticolaceae bacterium]